MLRKQFLEQHSWNFIMMLFELGEYFRNVERKTFIEHYILGKKKWVGCCEKRFSNI